MPSAAAVRLSEAHRLAQRRIGIATVARMRRVWPLLQLEDLDGSFADWLLTVEPIVTEQRLVSARLAAGYVSTLRSVELGVNPGYTPRLAGPLAAARLRQSMLSTGPIAVKAKLARGTFRTVAMSEAEAQSAGAAMRHAVNGGRETILASVAEDDRARGWRRLTSGEPCDFCSLLASNGAVYTDATVQFAAHDSCLCSAAPEYRD